MTLTANNKKTPPDIMLVAERTERVACDGNGGGLGHPRVWYSFDGKDEAICGYCGRHFVRKKSNG